MLLRRVVWIRLRLDRVCISTKLLNHDKVMEVNEMAICLIIVRGSLHYAVKTMSISTIMIIFLRMSYYVGSVSPSNSIINNVTRINALAPYMIMFWRLYLNDRIEKKAVRL